MNHDEIMQLAREYGAARNTLVERTENVRAQQHAVVRQYLRGIRNAIAATSTTYEALEAAIKSSADLFKRPRTRSIEGVKYGLRKRKGKITVENTETAIARLRKKLGANAEAYIRTKEALSLEDLRELNARTLAHCGITVTEDADAPTISVPRDNLNKLIDALLDGMEENEE